jgi:hypothetical protein
LICLLIYIGSTIAGSIRYDAQDTVKNTDSRRWGKFVRIICTYEGY